MTAADDTALSREDLLLLLRNYCRLEQEGSRMFRRWADLTDDPADKATLIEFSDIERGQANAIALHLQSLGSKMTDGPVPLEDAIGRYLAQIDNLPTLGERLRFNHTVMTVLERPVVMRLLLENSGTDTQQLFDKILDNEERILSWCDATATRLGVDSVTLTPLPGED